MISRARGMWHAMETLHAIVYFSPVPTAAFADLGLTGWWNGYFASRAAPLGAAPAGLVTATFFNFAPRMVEKALPRAWGKVSPAAVTGARYAAADAILDEIVRPRVDPADVREALDLTRTALGAADPAGRPLYGAYRDLPWPDEPLLALWHAATLVREHRGDGHVAALVAAGLDGCEALVTAAAAGTPATSREDLQRVRGWTDDEWDAAEDRLRGRGLLAPDGAFTTAGRALRDDVEARTDAAAAAPWGRLGDAGSDRLLALSAAWTGAIVAAEVIRFPNPIGLPRPTRLRS